MDILEEAREMAMSQHHGRTLMYTVIGTDWRPFGHPRIRRPIASVVLDKNIRDHPHIIDIILTILEEPFPVRNISIACYEIEVFLYG